MMIHELKTWPTMFSAVLSGGKTHEIRKDDRPFSVGDVLRLREWTPDMPDACRYDAKGLTGTFTGRMHDVVVTFVTAGGQWGLPRDMVVMSIRAPS